VENGEWKAGLRRHAYNKRLKRVEEPESFELSLAKLGLGVDKGEWPIALLLIYARTKNAPVRGIVVPVASGRASDLRFGVSLGVLRQRYRLFVASVDVYKLTRRRNDYIGQNRQLSGRLALTKWVSVSPRWDGLNW
jgi:hypothetical protein